MRLVSFVSALTISCFTVAVAQHREPVIDTGTPEGQLLQKIGQSPDENTKVNLMEQFVSQYPQSPSLDWVYAQLQPAYVKSGKADQAIEIGNKLLALDPSDVEASLQNLKAAELKKDPALVKQWSARTADNARKILNQPKPADDADWKNQQDYAKQVVTYTEYALYSQALQNSDPRQKLDLIEALRQANPKSQYVPQVAGQEFLAYRQLNQNAKAVEVAERALQDSQTDEEMLLVVADSYVQKKQNPEKTIAYANKIVELMATKPPPTGAADTDWQKRKDLFTGLAHQIAGKVYFTQNDFGQADKELRSALPLVSTNPDLKAETSFLLGLANYKLKRTAEAIKFNQICAAIPGPYQPQAQQNLKAIRAGK